jgi:hypothetical protein
MPWCRLAQLAAAARSGDLVVSAALAGISVRYEPIKHCLARRLHRDHMLVPMLVNNRCGSRRVARST